MLQLQRYSQSSPSSIILSFIGLVDLKFTMVPFEKLYFAWSNVKIKVSVYSVVDPNRTYPLLCKYSLFSNIAFKLGSITLNKNVANGSYDLNCTNDVIRVIRETTIHVYSSSFVIVVPVEIGVFLCN